MIEKEFSVRIKYGEDSRDIDSYVIRHAIDDYLDSVSGFYYTKIIVERKFMNED